ncbi:MAG: sensor domain-containing diguanylate cyclase [Nitrospiria bacterium]
MRRLAVIGGGQDGLETLAHAARLADWTVALIADPDPGALIFRLDRFGYRLARNVPLKIAGSLEAVREVAPLDLAVDATADAATRRALSRIAPALEVIGAPAARLLWSIAELPPSDQASAALKRFKPVTEQMDLSTPREPAYFVNELARLVARADTARLFRWEDPRQRLVTLGARGGPPIVSSLALRVARERRLIVASAADRSVGGDIADDGAYAALAVPIHSEDDLLGVLELRRIQRHEPFEADVAAWTEELAAHLVRAMKKMRTLREIQAAAQGEAVRHEMKAVLAGDQPTRAKLQRAVEALAGILHTQAVHLYVKDPQNGDVLLQASTSVRTEQAAGVRIAQGAGLIGEVARLNRAITLTEDSGDELASHGLLAAPLSVGKHAVGVLVVETPPGVEVTPRVIALMAETGEVLGAAIAGEAERHKMSQKVIKLSVVNEEGLQLLLLTDREHVLITGAAASAMILDAEAVVLRVRERRGDRLLVGGTYGLHRDEIDAALVRVDQSIARRVAESKAFLRSDRLADFGVPLPDGFPYRSVLAGPLLVDDRLVGSVSAYNKLLYQSFACGTFDADDQEILEQFSVYLGRSLTQAQEFHERQALITIDELTGLKNRRYVELRLPEELRRAERYQRKVSLLIMDVSGFDELSRPFSAQGRDELIRALAAMVRETFRNVDILAHLEGARFAVVMPDTGDRIHDVLDRLSQAIDTFRLRGPDGQPRRVTLAVGTCTYPADAGTVQELFERAERLTPL